MICTACGEPTERAPCEGCGGDPLLDGRYRLDAVLGQGSSGTTFAATRLADGVPVAVKQMPLNRADREKAEALFRREVRVLRQLHHPQIPRHLDDLVVGRGRLTTLYLVQERIDGIDLAREQDTRRHDEGDVLEILAGLLPILAYLHTRTPPIVHRDVKPRNVMRRADGSLVLLDFGAVRDALVDPAFGGSTVAGTFGYMAPEQFGGDASPASDLYGVGALAVALLTRREPHTLADYTGALRWQPHTRVSPALARLIDRMVDREPARRPGSAEEVLEEIAGIRGASRGDGAQAGAGAGDGAGAEATAVREAERDGGPVETPRFAELPVPTPVASRGPLVARVLGGAAVTLLLGFLVWSIGAFLYASSAVPPGPIAVAPATCTPTLPDEGPVPDGTSRYAFVGASRDGRRVALAVARQSDGRGELLVYEAGAASLILEHVVPPADVRRPWETFLERVLADQASGLRDAGIDPAVRPTPVPSCQDGASVRVGEETWSWQTWSAPCALGIGSNTSFALCPPDGGDESCLVPPRLDTACWQADPRLVGLYRLRDTLWAVAERPLGDTLPRFAAGVVAPESPTTEGH
jgi:hypothetical protein